MMFVLALLVALGFGAGGYVLGSQQSQAAAPQVDKTGGDAELKVPTGATVIAQCSKGRGTQYVLPKDIPTGPVYNVHNGKVIGIEFMVGQHDLHTKGSNFLDLPLFGKKFDHVNIGLLSKGHAGFPEPHYHVDVMMIPASAASNITCAS
jgi:hypothetical protein